MRQSASRSAPLHLTSSLSDRATIFSLSQVDDGHSCLLEVDAASLPNRNRARSAARLKIVPIPSGWFRRKLGRYLKPAVLIVDELGYLPIDKPGADLLFQIISQRYERAPMVITTNRAYKHWS